MSCPYCGDEVYADEGVVNRNGIDYHILCDDEIQEIARGHRCYVCRLPIWAEQLEDDLAVTVIAGGKIYSCHLRCLSPPLPRRNHEPW